MQAIGSAEISYLTEPQRQPPVMGSFIFLFFNGKCFMLKLGRMEELYLVISNPESC
jgi:hypothetical protein